jgi:hypothetical protein
MSEGPRACIECQGELNPIVIIDRTHREAYGLAYRQPDDRRSFWTGQYATAGPVEAFICRECGRIALYGSPAEAE